MVMWWELSVHLWKSWTRSIVFRRNLIAAGLSSVFVLLLAGQIWWLSRNFEEVVGPWTREDLSSIDLLNGGILFYLAIDFLLRYFFQPVPAVHRAYRLLPVPRRTLGFWYVFRLLFRPLNLLPLPLLAPVVLEILLPQWGPERSAIWLGTVLSLLLANIAAVSVLQNRTRLWPALLLPLVFLWTATVEISAWPLEWAFLVGELLGSLPLLLLGAGLCLSLLIWHFRALDFGSERIGRAESSRSRRRPGCRFLTTRGVPTFLLLECAMLWRNRRPRSGLLFGLGVWLVGWLFYSVEVSPFGATRISWIQEINHVYMGILMTGILMFMYGQFLFAWESSYLESILARPAARLEYVRAKLLLLLLFALSSLVLSLPFGWIEEELVPASLAFFFYNVGVNSIILLYLGLWSRQELDLTQTVFSNQGKGAAHYLILLPTLLPPVLIVALLRLSGFSFLYSVLWLGLLGIGLLPFQPYLTARITRSFQSHHGGLMVAGYREGIS